MNKLSSFRPVSKLPPREWWMENGKIVSRPLTEMQSGSGRTASVTTTTTSPINEVAELRKYLSRSV